MKKFLAIVLMLCIAAFTFTAMAEVRTYALVDMTDLEGNDLGMTEDYIGAITLTIDDEAMTFVLTSMDAEITGTVEATTEEDENGTYVVLALTAEGDTVEAILTVDEETGYDYIEMYEMSEDGETGVVYFLINAEALAEEEAA